MGAQVNEGHRTGVALFHIQGMGDTRRRIARPVSHARSYWYRNIDPRWSHPVLLSQALSFRDDGLDSAPGQNCFASVIERHPARNQAAKGGREALQGIYFS
jgi:hypothetical protein